MSATAEAVAVRCSGGLDSVVLVAHEARAGDSADQCPAGLVWERPMGVRPPRQDAVFGIRVGRSSCST
jgi:hypothetical protein